MKYLIPYFIGNPLFYTFVILLKKKALKALYFFGFLEARASPNFLAKSQCLFMYFVNFNIKSKQTESPKKLRLFV